MLGLEQDGMLSGVPGPELVESAKRRRFSAGYKLRLLREADACSRPGEVGALLRREGLYSSLLSEWRKQREAGSLEALERPRGRKPADRRDAEIAGPRLAPARALTRRVIYTASTGRADQLCCARTARHAVAAEYASIYRASTRTSRTTRTGRYANARNTGSTPFVTYTTERVAPRSPRTGDFLNRVRKFDSCRGH